MTGTAGCVLSYILLYPLLQAKYAWRSSLLINRHFVKTALYNIVARECRNVIFAKK